MKKRVRIFGIALAIAFAPLAAIAQTTPPAQQPREYDSAAATRIAKNNWPTAPVRAAKGMVVSDEKLASEAGIEIMKKGGNAVDAAVAVGFALAVVEPEAGNIGGGGFMLVRLASGGTAFVDYREVAPQKASREMYRRADGTFDPTASLTGYRSVGVPGTVAGLTLALRTYGTMKLPQVMAPAIRLAEEGFPVSPRLARLLRGSGATLERFPASRRVFLKGGAYFQPGEIFRQPELAATLRRIAQGGAAEFYRGQTAQDLANEMQKEGGLISLKDLARYEPKIREPLTASYKVDGHEWELITSPPPSSGGVATIEALNILAPLALKSWDDPKSVHWVIEAMRRVFADRAEYLADADFTKIPVRGLTSACYADALRHTIDPENASTSKEITAGHPESFEGKDSSSSQCAPGANDLAPNNSDVAVARALNEAVRGGHTTHFSVVDPAGNAVANTYTLNDEFGSGVTTANGFLLNDEMDDFTTHPGAPNMFGLIQSEANTIAPGKRPLSSMMPTILLRDGQLSLVIGSPGGPQIISSVFLTILNRMRLGMDAQAAINAPRFHQQWMPDVVLVEPIFSESVIKDLERRGYHVYPFRSWMGSVEAIGIDAATHERLGAPDVRRDGAAVGY
ncbi:MAG: gamma-glutamyltransferase [Candidatus Acidiferrales bacterium]